MHFYNTLTRKLEEFKPLNSAEVSFYHCGPTVYWTQHIGNLRGMLVGDLLRRTFEYLGYQVKHVRNYTDVGHLTSDADEGEDKMAKGVRREKKTPEEIAQKYIDIFEKDVRAMNMLEPSFKPRPSKLIPEIIEMVSTLADKGYAYVADLAVYYDVSKFKNYYALSRQKPEAQHKDLEDPQKKHSQDFALWFFKKNKHKDALQTWPSPWGEGFPGWHIECSVMSKKYLGESIDIHLGGVEHIPVHHTNEIAQSEAVSGKHFVNYWLHNEHLLVNNNKMAKSEGTGFSLEEIMAKKFDPMDLRYFFLQAHYRSQQNFTWEALKAAAVGRQNFLSKVFLLRQKALGKKGQIDESFKKRFMSSIEDDLNVPQALGIVWDMLESGIPPQNLMVTLYDFDRVLGLKIRDSLVVHIPEEIYMLTKKREELRRGKEFSEADKVRAEIEKKGYLIEDLDAGFVVKPKRF